ncbi:hypothetical protein G4Y73_09125 [Wenzhouxiangella sp. XN201]|uniref:hypothetical protein n=1 Tax=Wenzhouxiangella sp. XN201 TaxID=2710755 RepID=UPI0013C7875D|nr:hypothetical protein [Wenzhouxiangella sp. XN201]NEZ04305.1 hypothetical protein [Wenzhouxiangella sp. XN201]
MAANRPIFRQAPNVPLPARLFFTVWMAVWLSIVILYGSTQNFWWLCNVAQFIVLWCVWRPLPLLLSSQAGTVVLVGLFWTLDFAAGLVLGESPTGATAYMFNDELPLILRATSTYHMWLPLFVLWLCRSERIGYDPRGPWLQCLIGTAAIVGSWWFGNPERNLNFTQAPLGIEQVWLPDPVYLVCLCIATALLVYLPGHWLVRAATIRKPI